MSLRRVPSLENVGMRSIAFNIFSHVKKKNKSKWNDEVVYYRYKIFERDFSKKLLQVLECIYRNSEPTNDEKLSQLLKFLFCGQSIRSKKVKRCLKLLFNKDTSSLSMTLLHPSSGSNAQLFQAAIPKCKNLKILTLRSYDFSSASCISSALCWDTIVKVDLLESFINDEIAMKILTSCVNLQIFKARGAPITSKSLYCLCNKYINSKFSHTAELCNGKCGKTGKKIRCLVLCGNPMSHSSILCALRHLPSLKVFSDPFYGYMPISSSIPEAIALLKRQAFVRRQCPVVLKLTTLYLGFQENVEDINGILGCCPYLESFCFNVSRASAEYFTLHSFESMKAICLGPEVESTAESHEFQQFLSQKGKQLEYVGLWGSSGESLDATLIFYILSQCKKLKKLSVACLRVTCDQQWNGGFDFAANSPNELQKVSVTDVFPQNEAALRFFAHFLVASPNVKFLTVTHSMVDPVLTWAMKRTNFAALEEISLGYANVGNISLKHWIHNSLKRIILTRCTEAGTFTKVHKQCALEFNPELQIEVAELDNLIRSFAHDIL